MSPHALYQARSNGHSFIAKIDSGASCNCISKALWDKIKTSNKLTKSSITLTGAGGSKLPFLGFDEITCLIGRFTFTEEFAVIEGMVSDMLLGIRWEHKFNIHTGWTKKGNHYLTQGKHNFISESINKLKMHPIIKTKGKIMLKPESISIIEVQAPWDISGNKRYHLNPKAYLPQGIIPLDLVHSFEKTPRTPILNTSTNYKSIPRGTFEPVDEEINEIHTTVGPKWKDKCMKHMFSLGERKVTNELCRRASKEGKEAPEVLPEYLTNSNMEMETLMKRPEVKLKDTKDGDKWKAKVMNMLEAKFTSIMSKSSTDIG